MSDKIEKLIKVMLSALAAGEGEHVDLKRSFYDLRSQEKKAAFVKDILALANMVQSPGRHCHIFIGVKRDPRGGTRHDLAGVPSHPDDADIQNLVAGWTKDPPPLNYIAFEHDGRSLGALELKAGVHIPYVSSRTVGNLLWQGVVYVRRGSRNDLATPDETHAIVERRKLWVPSEAGQSQPGAPGRMSRAEVELLATASDSDGAIHILATDQTGKWVRAGQADYVDEHDRAIAALFRDALEGLVAKGYARQEGTRGTYYTLTSEGWQVGRDMNRSLRQSIPESIIESVTEPPTKPS